MARDHQHVSFAGLGGLGRLGPAWADMRIQYYQMGTGQFANVARVLYRGDIPIEYAYLDHETGMWVEHASVVDDVTQGDPDTSEIGYKQARKLGQRVAPQVEPEWLEGD